MKKVVRLTESDLTRIVRRVIEEQTMSETQKNVLYDKCKNGDCLDLFNAVMKKFGWHTNYVINKYYGKSYIEGMNSFDQRVQVSVPYTGMEELMVSLNAEVKRFPIFEILRDGMETQCPNYILCDVLN